MRRVGLATLILAALIFFRLWAIDLRPIHHDEGVNAFFVDQIWANGFYNYDPTNYHGPTLFYLGLISRYIFGDTMNALRLVPAIVSCFAIWLLFSYRFWLSKRMALWSALALSVSTGYYYYTRYFFHESLLIFSLILANLGFVRVFSKDKKGWFWVWVGGLCAFATKETAAIHTLGVFGSLGLLATTSLGREWFKNQWEGFREAKLEVWAVPVIVGLALFMILFSGFFYNPTGPLNFLKAFMPWMTTGVKGNGHEKEWYYWLKLLKQYEWPWIVGIVGCLWATIREKNLALKFLAAQALFTFGLYSLVPYKTPWLVISVSWMFSIGFGYLVTILTEKKERVVLALSGLVIAAQGYQMYDFNYKRMTVIDEPYVYVQSTWEYGEILKALEKASYENLRFRNELVECDLSSQWPVPWIFRYNNNIRWTLNPQAPEGKIIFVDESKANGLLEHLSSPYRYTKLIARGGVWHSYILIDASFAEEYGLNELVSKWETAGGPKP